MSPEPDPIHRLFALSVERSRMSSCLLIPVTPRPLRGACGVLDCRFPGVHTSVHPDSNPLCSQISLRLGSILYLLHVKRGIKPLFSGAGEGNRTLDVSLGSSSFAIKLHPRVRANYPASILIKTKMQARCVALPFQLKSFVKAKSFN